MTDGETNTLASRGLKEPFSSCAVVLCQFLVLAGNAGHYFPADCFRIEREIVVGVTYVISVQYSCAVVSVFLLWRESQFCSNTLQSRLFLKNIENILCKKNDPI
jgi:hypothetical protein